MMGAMYRITRTLALALFASACATGPSEPTDPAAYEIPLDPSMYSPNPPPEITAICGDGWVSYSEHQQDTCLGHHGVREWRHRPANG